jgi:hypothetical protein
MTRAIIAVLLLMPNQPILLSIYTVMAIRPLPYNMEKEVPGIHLSIINSLVLLETNVKERDLPLS